MSSGSEIGVKGGKEVGVTDRKELSISADSVSVEVADEGLKTKVLTRNLLLKLDTRCVSSFSPILVPPFIPPYIP